MSLGMQRAEKPPNHSAKWEAQDREKWDRGWQRLIERGEVWTEEQWRSEIREPEPLHLQSSIARLDEPFTWTRKMIRGAD